MKGNIWSGRTYLHIIYPTREYYPGNIKKFHNSKQSKNNNSKYGQRVGIDFFSKENK